MKNLKYISLSIIFFFLFSCTSEFEEINNNPNFPTVEEANPALLLPKILFQTGNEMTAGIGWGLGNIIAQLVATNNFTGTDRYLLGTYSGTWNLLYRNMRDANNLLTLGESLNNNGYQASALILRSWILANLTELWGDVPYSEALRGKEDQFMPKYDQQADIYLEILADLDSAYEIAGRGGTMDGDILYNGDLSKWQKLANSLKMRYIMRLENKWEELGLDGQTELQQIIDSGIHFLGNEDNAAIPYLAATNRWPLNTSRVGSFDEKRMSQSIEKVLKNLNDPRMQVLFRPVDNPDNNEFIGVPNGLSEDAASNFNGGANNQSRLGTRFREEPAAVEMMIMHYSELMFIAAEAAQKGYIDGEATHFYNEGIKANMSYLGITESQSYFDNPEIILQQDALEKIATQKWLSLFLVGAEAWFDYRRTGLPRLTPGPDAILDELPVRVLYPDAEQVLNSNSYEEVINRQGPNEINTRMWLIK